MSHHDVRDGPPAIALRIRIDDALIHELSRHLTGDPVPTASAAAHAPTARTAPSCRWLLHLVLRTT